MVFLLWCCICLIDLRNIPKMIFSNQILSGTIPKIKNRKAIIYTLDKDDVFNDYLISKIYSLNFATPIFINHFHVEEIEGYYLSTT